MSFEKNLENLKIVLPKIVTPLGSYCPSVVSGNYIYVSGQLPIMEGELLYKGKVDEEISIEEAAQAARICAVNSLAILRNETGSLDKIARIVKVTGYVASSEGFYKQADVINGASDLYYKVFGETGVHARAAVGVYQLPLNSPVEVDLIAEFKL